MLLHCAGWLKVLLNLFYTIIAGENVTAKFILHNNCWREILYAELKHWLKLAFYPLKATYERRFCYVCVFFGFFVAYPIKWWGCVVKAREETACAK